MTTPAEKLAKGDLYLRIAEDLRAKYPKQDHNYLSQVASHIYQTRSARLDSFGRVEYHDDVRAYAPRCFPTPPSIDPAEDAKHEGNAALQGRYRARVQDMMRRWIDGSVVLPRAALPPAKAPEAFIDAEILSKHYDAVMKLSPVLSRDERIAAIEELAKKPATAAALARLKDPKHQSEIHGPPIEDTKTKCVSASTQNEMKRKLAEAQALADKARALGIE
jgi:hypothetical protein